MKKYDFQKIDKLLQPLMEMMREEFPNDCKLIVLNNQNRMLERLIELMEKEAN